MSAAKYKPGQSVTSQSGLVYIVISIHELDYCGSLSYTVRRLHGGVPWGPHREIAECSLFPQAAIAKAIETGVGT